MNEKKLNLTVINLLATAQLFHEGLDELENTPYYKHSLKKASKNMELELTKTLDHHINHLWSIDSDTMQKIQSSIKTIIKELSTMDSVKIKTVEEIILNQNK